MNDAVTSSLQQRWYEHAFRVFHEHSYARENAGITFKMAATWLERNTQNKDQYSVQSHSDGIYNR